MAWWQILLGILMVIIALGVLIGIHELGHLAMAKAFKVYCFNYSIGFGPALISSKRSKKHETIWTLRAIPLGGFVSMYGEGAELDTDEYIPPSRSLEGVARYKRAIIVSAGVILNTVLGFVLILCHNFFDHISFNTYNMKNQGDQYAISMVVNVDNGFSNIKTGDYFKLYSDPLAYVTEKKVNISLFLVDKDIKIGSNTYALCFKNSIATTKVDPDLSTSFVLMEQITPTEQIDSVINSFSDSTFKSIYVINRNLDTSDKVKMKEVDDHIKSLTEEDKKKEFREEATTYYSKIGNYSVKSGAYYKVDSSTPSLLAKVGYYSRGPDGKLIAESKTQEITLKPNSKKDGWDNVGIRLKRTIERYSFGKTLKVSCQEWCDANILIFKGIGSLFTGNAQVGGLLAISQSSISIFNNFGFERFLYFWGMISCNLAIINLLPFPGLDGFTLVITAYEGIRKKQVPAKLKGILSFIGLALLFALMIAVLVLDIGRIIG